MEPTERTPENDILNEPYKGPGALVTGAGEGAITHYGTGFAGLIGGGLVGYAAPNVVHKVEDGFVKFQKNTETSVAPIRWLGKAAGKVREWSREAGEKLAHSKMLRSAAQHSSVSGRMEAMIFGGGLMAFIGFFVVPFYFMFTGARHSNQGRQQFERAKDAVVTARAERDALREKYVEATTKLEEFKAGQAAGNGPLQVAKDDPVVRAADDQSAIVAKDSPTQPSEPVIGPAKTTGRVLGDSPTTISAPRIEEPTIGPAKTTGRVLGDSPTTISAPRIEEPTIGPARTTGRVLGDSPTTISKPTIKEPVLGPEHAGFAARELTREAEAAQADLVR